MEFNINEKVKIKLTPHGVAILKAKNYTSFINNLDPSNAVLHEVLWVVMNTFGKDMYNGGKQLFEDNIITF